MKGKNYVWSWFSLALILAMVLAACAPATPTPATEEPGPPPTDAAPEAMIDCKGSSPGDEVTLLYQWSGAEEEKFNAAIAPVVDACGLTVVPESSRDQAVLDTRVQSGDPWDIVIWPSTGPVATYSDSLVALGDAGAAAANYAPYWVNLGSFGGSWLAVPVKADIKSIIWYSPVAFEAAGYSVPTTLAELDALVEQMVADGNVPWSMGMESGDATGWTGSDFIQDLLLAQQGPDYVLGLLDGSVAYNDAGVVQAYETYLKWAGDPAYTVGGAEGTLSTGFLAAIHKPF
ncbi:MAG: extracellular solute-binding protein, partial [Chloroflexi bacterium]|nr:extracellular solute-binding protein [Chloroflexota bacterium]